MDFPIISSLIILPTIGAIFILFGRSSSNYIAAKNISLFVSLANFILSLYLWYIFDKNIRNQGDLLIVINLIKKYNIINDCYNKANYFINIASNALNIFEDSKEKEILLNLTYFSLERKY